MQPHAEPDADVIVVGGGLSGLTCAWRLQQCGLDVLLLESASRAGGCIGTYKEDGYLLETGPNSALDTSPLIGRLLQELAIGDAKIVSNPAASKRFVVRGGRPMALPMSPLQFISSGLFSTAAKLRLCAEPFLPRGSPSEDETVAAFVRRRLGDEFLHYAINPFVGGVYAGRPEQLSLRSAFPRLHALEQRYGSLIRGQWMGRRARAAEAATSKHTAAMFSFRGGMETLTIALAQRLKRIVLNAPASVVQAGPTTFSMTAGAGGAVRTLSAPAVVLAVPAYAAAPLVRLLAPATAAALEDIPYPPVSVVHTGYEGAAEGHALDGFGMLVPECEHRQILGSIFSSTLFHERAAPGHRLLTTFIGGTRQAGLASLEDGALHALVRQEHRALLGMEHGPAFQRVRKWARAIPQYTVGHEQRMQQVAAAEAALGGLFFCANYRGGISIGDCIASAEAVAGRVVAQLATR